MTAFYKYSAAEISNGIKQKQFSARDVIESALYRLDSVNPSINAVIDTYHGDALANADRIDHCIARDESLSDLAGVPVTIKVNIDQAGKINTNGLLIQKDHLAEIDNPAASSPAPLILLPVESFCIADVICSSVLFKLCRTIDDM